MSTNEQTPFSQPTSVVRNTLGKEPVPQDPGRLISDEALREYCDRNHHQILPIIAEKVHQEKAQQEKLKAVKARLNFEETSRHSKSGTPIKKGVSRKRSNQDMSAADPEVLSQGVTAPNHLRKRVHKEKQCSKGWKKVCCTGSETRGRVYPYTQTTQGVGHTTVAVETLKVATKALVREQRSPLPRGVIPREHPQEEQMSCQKVKATQEIRYFDFPKTRMPSHIKTYDRSEDPEDHLKIFQSAAKTKRWAMPTWCHMFNSTLTGNARGREGSSGMHENLRIHARDYQPRANQFHGEVGHNTDECMHLKKQIEEILKAGKLSYLIKELKQNNGKEQPKVTKKGETFGKDKALTILMVQPWERVARQRITHSFS
ncbi:hypothetical protein Tco_1070044 [Tanacetum coccineum]|uniref:Reverse transcriptase domain-containing protein n=1 Tax=Tanacetum coccineum TaxID=301880 RepID=A0ABQ5HM27_9ASTR